VKTLRGRSCGSYGLRPSLLFPRLSSMFLISNNSLIRTPRRLSITIDNYRLSGPLASLLGALLYSRVVVRASWPMNVLSRYPVELPCLVSLWPAFGSLRRWTLPISLSIVDTLTSPTRLSQACTGLIPFPLPSKTSFLPSSHLVALFRRRPSFPSRLSIKLPLTYFIPHCEGR
jgi:hypothetical protein